MAYNNPSVADFKNQFTRDFPYGTDADVSVLDQDIASSFLYSNASINQELWADQGTYTLAYLLLSAHFMVMNLRASSQGINGQYNWAQNSKSVGSVSESFSIPERISNNPALMAYTKTNYGAQYLNLLWPVLLGQVFAISGTTQP